MNRYFLIGLIAGLITGGCWWAANEAFAKPSSPAPDGVGSDCSWKEAGQHMVIGGEEFVCHCARLTGPNGKQILCRWWNTESLPKEPKKPAPDPKKKPDPKPKPKYGISTGALNHA